jgi:hypothetical protein
MTHKSPKEKSGSRTPTKSCAKNLKATDELEFFALAELRIINARTQFNEDNEPFAAAKKKRAQATPMVN